jgi:hypothetical protein
MMPCMQKTIYVEKYQDCHPFVYANIMKTFHAFQNAITMKTLYVPQITIISCNFLLFTWN